MRGKLDNLLSNTADMALNRRARWIITNLKLKKETKILDVGCGDGFYLHLLSHLDQRLDLFGIDTDHRALATAKKNLSSKTIKITKASIMEIPYPTNFFDSIIISEVLEHLDDDQVALKEVRRVLKRGGQLFVSVPNYHFPFLWDPLNFILQNLFNTHIKSGFWAGIWNQHQRLYKKEQLIRKLKRAGFKNIKSEVQTYYCLPFNHYLINLGARILAARSANKKSQAFSKFTQNGSQSSSKLVFAPFFLIDKLNDIWNTERYGVSLVASANK